MKRWWPLFSLALGVATNLNVYLASAADMRVVPSYDLAMEEQADTARQAILRRTLDSIVARSDGLGLTINTFGVQDFFQRTQNKTATTVDPPDLVFASPSLAGALERFRQYRPLVALWPEEYTTELRESSSAALVTARKNIASLSTLRSVSGQLLWINEAGGIPVRTLLSNDLQLQQLSVSAFFNRSKTVTEPVERTLLRLLDSQTQTVALIPACALEIIAQKTSDLVSQLQVVEARGNTNLRCLHSTTSTLDWILLASPKLSRMEVLWWQEQLTSTLLGKGYRWQLIPETQSLQQVLIRGQDSIWSWFDQPTLREMVISHIPLLLGFCLFLLVLVVWSFVAAWRLRQKSLALMEAQELKRLHDERFKALERASVVGQMSSIVAHEIKQPLTAIHNYAGSLALRLQRKN